MIPMLPTEYGAPAIPYNSKAPFLARRVEGIWTANRPTYICHWGWAATYFGSTLCLILFTLLSFSVGMKRKALDFFMTMTGALCDSRYIGPDAEERSSGSWRDAAGTARSAWDVKVCYFYQPV